MISDLLEVVNVTLWTPRRARPRPSFNGALWTTNIKLHRAHRAASVPLTYVVQRSSMVNAGLELTTHVPRAMDISSKDLT